MQYQIEYIENHEVVKTEVIDVLNPISVCEYKANQWTSEGVELQVLRGCRYQPVQKS